jgi:hypothetical protein
MLKTKIQIKHLWLIRCVVSSVCVCVCVVSHRPKKDVLMSAVRQTTLYLIFYICALVPKNFCSVSMYVLFVMYLPEDGHMIGRNM